MFFCSSENFFSKDDKKFWKRKKKKKNTKIQNNPVEYRERFALFESSIGRKIVIY